MSTAILTFFIEDEDGKMTESIHAIKSEGEVLRACVDGDFVIYRLRYILELLTTKQYSNENTSS
jgi:hypothetical protein